MPSLFGVTLSSAAAGRLAVLAVAASGAALAVAAITTGETGTAVAAPPTAPPGPQLVGVYSGQETPPNLQQTEPVDGPDGKLPTKVLPTPPPTPTPSYVPGDTSVFGPDPGVPQDLRGNAKHLWDALRNAGYSEAGAAGVLGNLQQESNMNPAAPGGGLAQWINGRWSGPEGVVAWCTARNLDPYSLKGQTLYLLWDIKRFGATTGGSLDAYLKQATDPADAANVFQYSFEKAGIPMMENRIRYARAWYAELKGT